MDKGIKDHLLTDGSYEFTCPRSGHPGGGEWSCLEVQSAPDSPRLGGLAGELNLPDVLPKVVHAR
jgi:hypothetical protein